MAAMSARCSQPVAVSEVSRTIRTTHTTYGNPRLVVRVEVDVYRYWDSCQTLDININLIDTQLQTSPRGRHITLRHYTVSALR